MAHSILVLLVDILEMRLLVLCNTLLNILLFQLELNFLAIVSDNVSHAVHDSLNFAPPFDHLLLTCLLAFHLKAHIPIQLIRLCLFVIL